MPYWLEVLVWVAVYGGLMAFGYLIGRTQDRAYLNRRLRAAETERDVLADELAEMKVSLNTAWDWRDRTSESNTELRAAIKAHRDANTSNCNNISCEKGCGHDLRLYAAAGIDPPKASREP